MSKVDTSTAGVERLAARIATGLTFGQEERTAATLRALCAERDMLLAALKGAHFSMAWHIEQQGRGVAMDAEYLRRVRAAIAKAEGSA